MVSAELKFGRVFGLTIENGEDFMEALAGFFKENNIRQAHIPSIVGAFSEARIVGTCEKLDDPNQPSYGHVYLECLEIVGSGTMAYDEKKGMITPNIHVSAGIRSNSAIAYTGHLMSGKVLFLVELMIIEILEPSMRRIASDLPYTVLKYVK
jgi:predicted DNA-binding protein with PD1-like motif